MSTLGRGTQQPFAFVWTLRDASVPRGIDWQRVGRAAMSIAAGFVRFAEEYQRITSEGGKVDPEIAAARNAARVLGVAIDASPDAVRAALRQKLSTSGLHPDHGGNAEPAKRFIAAKNLLIDRGKARATGTVRS